MVLSLLVLIILYLRYHKCKMIRSMRTFAKCFFIYVLKIEYNVKMEYRSKSSLYKAL